MKHLLLIFNMMLFAQISWAKFSTEPEGCLDKFAPPCSILTETKSEFQNPEFKLSTSKDALFQFQNAQTLYLARGVLWLNAAMALTIDSKFGRVLIHQPGEYWIESTADQLIVKSIKESLGVEPRGGREIEVKQGFEMRVGLVNEETHEAEFSVPIVINLQKHLADLPKAMPKDGFNLQDYATGLGRVVLEAAKVNADLYQDAVQRKVSSAEERANRLKYEAAHNAARDSYLQKLYRAKNNFEDQ